ncbi:hypothetical protein VNO77_33024 [Canavalia gladiata]|uniref:Uncharacterized protein n=1 Tax=Canavalia gladiata TaxID=3824 RepID=A0AAN9KEU1_CANGL
MHLKWPNIVTTDLILSWKTRHFRGIVCFVIETDKSDDRREYENPNNTIEENTDLTNVVVVSNDNEHEEKRDTDD